jgi:hypothetical protein
MQAAAVVRTAAPRIRRAPARSSRRPRRGAASAASSPPSEAAPEIAVRDQPKLLVIGATKIDRMATPPPAREKPAQQTAPRITQP